MSVHSNIKGIKNSRKLGTMTDERILDLVKSAEFSDWEPNFIKLRLKPKVIRGNGRWSILAFQHANVFVNRKNNTVTGTISKEVERSTDFNSDEVGARISYIPDTEQNRKILVATFHYGAKYVIDDATTKKEIQKLADAFVNTWKKNGR